LSLNKRAIAFIIWTLALWILFNWALYELCFPTSTYAGGGYGMGVAWHLQWIIFWNLPVLGGFGLFFSFRKRLRWKGTLLLLVIVTFALTSWMTLGAVASAENKAKVQWYIDDLKSQGFDVEVYVKHPSMGRAATITGVYSYSNFSAIAKDLNCTSLYVYTGTPISFAFFFSSNTWIMIMEHGLLYCFYPAYEK
jgi:hypothetical protein